MLLVKCNLATSSWGDVSSHPSVDTGRRCSKYGLPTRCRLHSNAGCWAEGGYARAPGSGCPALYSQTPVSPTAGLWETGHAAAAAVMRVCVAAPLCVCAACRLRRRRRWMITHAHSRAHRSWRPAMAPPARRSGPLLTGQRSATPSHLCPTHLLCSAGRDMGAGCPLRYRPTAIVTSPFL